MAGLTIDTIDVGQGDSILLATSKRRVLIDAGPTKAGPALVKFIGDYYPKGLSAAILTHVDDDHVGGMSALLAAGIHPEIVFFNDPRNVALELTKARTITEGERTLILSSVQSSSNVMDHVKRLGIRTDDFMAGESLDLGDGFRLKCLSPSRNLFADCVRRFSTRNWDQLARQLLMLEKATRRTRSSSAENESSMIIEVTQALAPGRDRRVALLTSDGSVRVLEEVTGADYLWVKIPHHGSWNNSSPELIAQWRGDAAEWTAALCVGDNSHGHPAAEVMDWYREAQASISCTACHGHVRWTLGADGESFESSAKGSCVCG